MALFHLYQLIIQYKIDVKHINKIKKDIMVEIPKDIRQKVLIAAKEARESYCGENRFDKFSRPGPIEYENCIRR
jgi:hypothetical protein